MMKYLKKLFTWCLLISKRLFCRPSFIVMICMVPLLVLGMRIVGSKENGVISIALAQSDANDSVSSAVIEKLTADDPLIRFTVCSSPEEARNAVISAKADAAWIFPEDMEQRFKTFIRKTDEDNYVIDIVQREDTIALKLANERLCSALYSFCSELLYIDYVRENIPGLENLSDAELEVYYEDVWANGDVFEYSYVSESSDSSESNYLTAPMRGLLYILCVMGGLAAAMFYQKDSENGLIDRIPRKERFLFEFICHLLPITDIAAVSVISLAISETGVSLGREIAVALIYSFACTAMCMFIRRIFTKIEWLAVISPLFIIVLIVICPVFINFGSMRPLQMLTAPYYAITAVHNAKYIAYMAIYSLVFTVINYMIYRIKNRV